MTDQKTYKIMGTRGRITIPKWMRECADMRTGCFLRLGICYGVVTTRRAYMVDVADNSPESWNDFIAYFSHLSRKKQRILLNKLTEQINDGGLNNEL